jgi:hypothetical protein
VRGTRVGSEGEVFLRQLALFTQVLTGAGEFTNNRERRSNVDIRRGEMVEAELDTLITRRHEKRVERAKASSRGAAEKMWSAYWEVDYGLKWDNSAECWVDGDGAAYDGRRLNAYSPVAG